MNESTLGVHEIELVRECGPCLSNGGCVRKHAAAKSVSTPMAYNKKNGNLHGAVNLGKITVRNHVRWLEADTDLETSWAPIDELDGTFCLEGCNGNVDILGNNITTVQQASSHVFTVAGVALNHLVVGLEARHGDVHNRVGFVGCSGSRDNRSICNEREMNTWVWNQVGLELVEINVEGTIKTKGRGDGGDNYERTLELMSTSRYNYLP
jgi:hypothetical protein